MFNSMQNLDQLSRPERQRLNQILQQYESDSEAGSSPDISQYIPPDQRLRLPVMVELVLTDLEYRYKADESKRLEDYVQSFPDLLNERETFKQLISAEYELRNNRNEIVFPCEYRDRFPDQLDALHEIFGEEIDTRSVAFHLDGTEHEKPIDIGDTAIIPSRQKKSTSDRESFPRRFSDNYELVAELGRGGMGIVYQAVHSKLKKSVALKVLSAEFTRTPKMVARFEREIEAVGKLEDPGIVRAMDAGQVDGIHFLVMEYVEGINLQRFIAENGPQSVVNACDMIRQTAVALAHAHEHGLVHRDIKPSNLLLTKQSKIKILDLGLARLFDETTVDSLDLSLTGEGQFLGTPDFMAPEQWDDCHVVDHRVDLYALGCTLFFLLHGRAPFSDANHSSTSRKMRGHLDEPPPDLHQGRPDVPQELNRLYQQLMAKDQAHRLSSSLRLADLLTDIIQRLSESDEKVIDKRSRSCEAYVKESVNGVETEKPGKASLDASAKPHTSISETDQPRSLPRHSVDRWPEEKSLFIGSVQPNSSIIEENIGHGKRMLVGLSIVGAALVLLLGVIIIKITPKDGKTVEIKVPGDSMIEITNQNDQGKAAPTSNNSIGVRRSQSRNVAMFVLEIGGTLQSSEGSIETIDQIPNRLFEITEIHLAKTAVRDEDLAIIAQLKLLRSLHLGFTQTGDLGLKHLAGLTNLRSLTLDNTQISNDGVKHLHSLTKLTYLSFDGTAIGDAGLSHLADLNELSTLLLSGTPVSDIGLEYLKDKKLLATLNLDGTRVTDKGLTTLSNFVDLEYLGLHGTNVSDDGVEVIRQLSNLSVLHLQKTDITDHGVGRLTRLKNLAELHLDDTKVTALGIEKLHRALPNCLITHAMTTPTQ
ncbi:MAG: protein kinase [Planctomycetota bacterium]|nr:protein kinase [Planctomycetota bacterium]MDA1213495.1 protein kinase [Planctomycetota bacterium]